MANQLDVKWVHLLGVQHLLQQIVGSIQRGARRQHTHPGRDAVDVGIDRHGGTVLRSSQSEPTAVLAPGRYVVTAETAEQPLRNAIEIKANEHRTFDFSGQ